MAKEVLLRLAETAGVGGREGSSSRTVNRKGSSESEPKGHSESGPPIPLTLAAKGSAQETLQRKGDNREDKDHTAFLLEKNHKPKPGLVVHTHNPSTQKAEAGGSGDGDQLELKTKQRIRNVRQKRVYLACMKPGFGSQSHIIRA